MTPIGSRHAGTVNRVAHALMALARPGIIVSVQNPIRLDEYNEPQPDVSAAEATSRLLRGQPPRPGATC